MKIDVLPKKYLEDGLLKDAPRLQIFIGRYCYDYCDEECRFKASKYIGIIQDVVFWLYKNRIVLISKDAERYSGTKYCPHHKNKIHDCWNCKYHRGIDSECGNEKYSKMTISQHEEDSKLLNGAGCRYWEQGIDI